MQYSIHPSLSDTPATTITIEEECLHCPMPAHRPAASDDASWVLASWLVLVARLQLLLKEALRKHYIHWKTPKHQDISSCGTSGISKTHAVFPPNPSLLIFSQGSHAKKCVEISSSCNGLTEMAILLPSPF